MSKFFINRPIVAMVISILMVILGLVAMARLPIAQFPNIVPPAIQVNATYTGADALTLEQSVATPIEQQMSGVDNLDYMYSVNANNGQMTLYNYFDLKTDASTDQLLAQMREGQAESQLPTDVRNYGVTVQKSTSSPLIMFALYSPKGTYDNIFLANYSYININDQMTRIKGIASVTVFGAGQYAMRIWVNPDQLAKLNITIPEIMNAVNAQNTVNPAGQVGAQPVPKGQEYTYSVRAQGRLQSEEQFGNIVHDIALLHSLGIRLVLWIGKAVPLPAPRWVSHALQRTEVCCDTQGKSGYQLTFGIATAEQAPEIVRQIADPHTHLAQASPLFFNYVVDDEIVPFVIDNRPYFRNAAKTNRKGVEIGFKSELFKETPDHGRIDDYDSVRARVYSKLREEEAAAPPPTAVAELVSRLAGEASPRLRNVIGKEKIFTILKRLLPERWFEPQSWKHWRVPA